MRRKLPSRKAPAPRAVFSGSPRKRIEQCLALGLIHPPVPHPAPFCRPLGRLTGEGALSAPERVTVRRPWWRREAGPSSQSRVREPSETGHAAHGRLGAAAGRSLRSPGKGRDLRRTPGLGRAGSAPAGASAEGVSGRDRRATRWSSSCPPQRGWASSDQSKAQMGLKKTRLPEPEKVPQQTVLRPGPGPCLEALLAWTRLPPSLCEPVPSHASLSVPGSSRRPCVSAEP